MAVIDNPILNSPFIEQYYPDSIAQVRVLPVRGVRLPLGKPRGRQSDLDVSSVRGVRLQSDLDVLNLIVEVTGEARKDKAAKVATARTLWVPAVNNHGGFGRWAFVEVTDPWDAQRTIRAALSKTLQEA